MFHTYVLAWTGSVIDFDRASFLMDKDILRNSLDAMRAERDNHPRDDATYDAQWSLRSCAHRAGRGCNGTATIYCP